MRGAGGGLREGSEKGTERGGQKVVRVGGTRGDEGRGHAGRGWGVGTAASQSTPKCGGSEGGQGEGWRRVKAVITTGVG